MIKPLTIWIPTYRRPRALAALLANLQQVGLIQLAEIVVSDNDPEGPLAAAFARGEAPLPHEVVYRCNLANLSAGVNFLRGFEACRTPWIMVVGDDDLFAPNAAHELEGLLAQLSDGVIAVKFDSTLFGMQSCCNVSDLAEYVDQLDSRSYADAFNNICLVSNWLFRCDSCLPHLASASSLARRWVRCSVCGMHRVRFRGFPASILFRAPRSSPSFLQRQTSYLSYANFQRHSPRPSRARQAQQGMPNVPSIRWLC